MATNDNGKVKYTVSLDDSSLKQDAQRIIDQFVRVGDEAKEQGSAIDDAFSSAAKSVGKAFAAIGIGTTLTELVKKAASARSEMQSLELTFSTMLGSADKANTMMQELIKTAAITPFSMTDVMDGAKQLLAFGIAAEDVNDTLIRLGDIAAGTGAAVGQLTNVYGQIKAAGKMNGGDLLQFINAGVPIINALSNAMGVAESQVKDLISAGKVGFPQVQAAIKSLTDEGSTFGGLMEKQATTIEGQISTIEDNIDQMFAAIGKNSEGIINDALGVVSSLVENYERVGKVLAEVVLAYGTYKAALMALTAAQAVYKARLMATTTAEIAHYGWLVLCEKAQALLNATMLKNPYVLAAAAIAGLTVAIIELANRTTLAEKITSDFDKAMSKAEASAMTETQKLYQLKGQLEATTKGTKEYEEIKQKIIDQYGQYNSNLATEIENVDTAATAYEKLAKSIQNAAMARGFEAEMEKQTESQKERLSEQLDDLREELLDEFGDEEGSRLYTKITSKINSGGVRLTGGLGGATLKGFTSDIYKAFQKDDEVFSIVKEIVNDRNISDKTIKDLKHKYGIDQPQEIDEIGEVVVTGTKTEKKTKSEKDIEKEQKAAAKAQKEAEKQEQKRQTAQEKAAQETLALIQENEMNEAQAYENGGERTLAVINANASKQAEAIAKRVRTLQKANAEAQTGGLNDNGLTSEQQNEVDKAYQINEQNRLRQIQAIEDAEEQALRDYIIKYGSYEEQKLAIAQDYANKIKNATTAGEKMSLNAEMQTALANLDKEMQSGTDWSGIFASLDNYSLEYLKKLKSQLQDALSQGGISSDVFSDLSNKLNEVDAQINKRKTSWKSLFGLQIPELEEINRLEQEAATAADVNQIAQENYNKALAQELEMRRQIAQYLNQTTGSNYSESDINNQVVGSYLQSNTSDDVFSQMVQKWSQSQAATSAAQTAAESAAENAAVTSAAAEGAAAGGASGGGGASGLAITEAIITGINQNLQSMSAMVDEFGWDDSDFGKGLKQFAESSQYATDAFQSLKSGDIAGTVLNLNNAFGSLGDTLGSWGFGSLFGSSDKTLAEDVERLTNVNNELISAINNLAEIMEDSSVADATSVYEQQKADLEAAMANTQEMMDRSASASSSGFMGIGGHHSSDYKINQAMSSADWARVSKAAGVSVTSANDFFSLTSEQMANVRNYATDLYAKIKQYADDGYQDAAQYMDTYTEYYQQLIDLENEWREKLTSTSFDDLKSDFKSALKDMEYDTTQFAENLNDIFAEAALEGMLSVSGGYYDQLQSWYEDFASYMEDGALSSSDAATLKESYDAIVNSAVSEWKTLRDALGIETSSSQSASSGSWQEMSEDTGQELNGRFTAIQATTVQIYEQMKADSTLQNQSFSVLSEMYTLVFTCSEYLNRIATNSDYLPSIDRRLEKIRIHVEKL